MKQLLNTLFVTTPGAYLRCQGQGIAVRVDGETRLHVPVHTLGSIVCLGRVGCSPKVFDLCGRSAVTVSFLSESGRFYGRVHGPTSGNVLLRREQYRVSDDPVRTAAVARAVVVGKVANCRTALRRAAREHSDAAAAARLGAAADRLGGVLESLPEGLLLNLVRGHEGDAARLYFGAFDDLVTGPKPEFAFTKRSRRPPLDRINALLSFLYTLLVNDLVGAVESVGLDPAVGFLHRDRPGRPGLALDLMEELRPVLADRLAVSLVNRRQVKPNGFRVTETGAVLMDEDTRKEVIIAYQKRKQDEITHPYLEEKMPLGLLPHVQALLLARHLRGDLDGYPAFLWR